MDCPECGQEAEDGAAYCLNNECGARLSDTVSTPAGRSDDAAAATAASAGTDDSGGARPPSEPPPTRPAVPRDGAASTSVGTGSRPPAVSAADGPAASPAPGDARSTPTACADSPATASGEPVGTRPGVSPRGAGARPGTEVRRAGSPPPEPEQGVPAGPGRPDTGPVDRPGPRMPANRLLPVGAAVLAVVLVGVIGLVTWDREKPHGRPTPPVPVPVAVAPTHAPVDLSAPPTIAEPTTSSTPTGSPVTARRTPKAEERRTTPTVRPKPTTKRTTTAPAAPAPTTPSRTRGGGGRPYLTASVSAFCRDGWSWAFTISGQLHNASVGYDPLGWVYHPNRGEGYGYPINGDGSTRFSGTVPPNWGGEHTLTAAYADWELQVWLNPRMDGDGISVGGTVRNPC